MTQPAPGERYQSFNAFYPYYIHEHSNQTCRRIHVVGSALVLLVLLTAIVTLNPWWLLAISSSRRTARRRSNTRSGA